MNLLDRYVTRTSFADYDDLKKSYRVNVPERFNFGRDVVDELRSYRTEQNRACLVQ